MTTEQVVEAIKLAKQRQAVPFVVVIPVTPEALLDVPDVREWVGETAKEQVQSAVDLWLEQHGSHA